MVTRKVIIVIVMLFMASMSLAALGDADWYVDPCGSDAWDCNSWDSACKTIEGAIKKADDGDVIEVNEGTYVGRCDANGVWHYAVDPDGNNVVITSKNPNDATVVAATIISPFWPAYGCGAALDGVRRSCNFDANESRDCQLRGFTILTVPKDLQQHGYSWLDDERAVVKCESSSPTISHCLFREEDHNDPVFALTGIDCNNSSALIEDCTFSDNDFFEGTASAPAGKAIWIHDSQNNVTIKDCNMLDNNIPGQYAKGVIHHIGGDVNVIGCTITGNTGGGIYSEVLAGSGEANLMITDCNISGNTPCGVYCVLADGGQITITNCTIADNSMSSGVDVDSNDANVVMRDCNFTGNMSSGYGGAINVQNANDLTIEACTIVNNKTNQDDGGGIRLLHVYGRGLISNCVITDNRATQYGGGINNHAADDLTVENCTISGNKALCGGGINSDYGLTITNCEITGNKSWSYGGGIDLKNDGDSLIRNCTIADNCADANGGGIYVHSDDNDVVVKNCILWGNQADEAGDQIASDNDYLDISYSDGNGCGGSANWLWDADWDGGDNNDVDPCFVGPGSWTLDCNDANAVWVAGDYHLDANSACIDDGDPNDPNNWTDERDIDDQPRVMVKHVDMGSDEAGYFPRTDPNEYDQWVLVGKPECWCYQRQCHGDADGRAQGKGGNVYVSTWDAEVFNAAKNKTFEEIDGVVITVGGKDVELICADFAHDGEGKAGNIRVSTNDAAIFNTYKNQVGPDPDCCD